MTDAPQTFTAWITDGRLFHKEGGGIRARSALAQERGSHMVYHHPTGIYYMPAESEGRIWHRTREAAVARANEMRASRIASLERQIARLRKMEF